MADTLGPIRSAFADHVEALEKKITALQAEDALSIPIGDRFEVMRLTIEQRAWQDKAVVESILADAVEEIRRLRSDWIMEQVRLMSLVQTRTTGSWTSEDAERWTQKYVQDWNADNPGLYGLWTYYEKHIRPAYQASEEI